MNEHLDVKRLIMVYFMILSTNNNSNSNPLPQTLERKYYEQVRMAPFI